MTNELFPNEREDNPNCKFTQPAGRRDLFRQLDPLGSVASDSLQRRSISRASSASWLRRPRRNRLPRQRAVFRLSSRSGVNSCHFGNAEDDNCRSIPTKATSLSTVQRLRSPCDGAPASRTGLRKAMQPAANSAQHRYGVWGKRLFFLHDGRTADLLTAIKAHQSQGSEANKVIANFNALARCPGSGFAELSSLALTDPARLGGSQESRLAAQVGVVSNKHNKYRRYPCSLALPAALRQTLILSFTLRAMRPARPPCL